MGHRTIYFCDKCGKETASVAGLYSLDITVKDDNSALSQPPRVKKTVALCMACQDDFLAVMDDWTTQHKNETTV